jgi:hypothetical protein
MSHRTTDRLAEIHAVAIARVHDDHELGDPDPGKIKDLTKALQRAEAVGEEYEGVDVIPHLYVARSAPTAVVEISRLISPETILIAADDAAAEERDPGAGTRVGKVTQALMRFAQCRVVLTAGAHQDSLTPRKTPTQLALEPKAGDKDGPKSPAEAARAYAEGL